MDIDCAIRKEEPNPLELAIGRAGPLVGRAKIGSVFLGQNFNSPARPKNLAGLAKYSFEGKKNSGGPGRAKFGPVFFRAYNLMAQPGPNFWRTGLAHRVGPILPPLDPITETSTAEAVCLYDKWERSNCLSVMFIKTKISTGIRGSVEQIDKVKPLLKAIDE